jgi:diaminohydroxyphosphoribosylaminopyrimidine deaminase/5-amino-6-(5-phosphoribosylamino)uracil reductase
MDWMARALELAEGSPWPDPNPRVGCVIVSADGSFVAEGFHRGAGTAHAEVAALEAAGDRARGATAYVTLEPCSHTGRTAPCTDALIAAGIGRVVFAQSDPNPVATGGAEVLAAAGITVVGGVLAERAQALNAAWARTVELGRPLVSWKFAATLDGRSAAADGTSQWITGSEARADVHTLRGRCDALLVGTGTVLADDPRLTVRAPDGTATSDQPLRAVMGLRELPASAAVFRGPGECVVLPTREPCAALATLWDKGVRHVWLEGGPTLAAAFLNSGLVDEVYAYLAPALLGAGPSAVGDLGISSISDILRLRLEEVVRVGNDIRVRALPVPQAS